MTVKSTTVAFSAEVDPSISPALLDAVDISDPRHLGRIVALTLKEAPYSDDYERRDLADPEEPAGLIS